MTVSDGPGTAPSRPPRGSGNASLAGARTSFQVEETVPRGVVRGPILASWTRSRASDVPTDHLEVPFAPDLDADTVLAQAAGPVLQDVADQFASEPISAILCDAQGTVLQRRTGDTLLERHLDRVWLAPGFNYAEQSVGTNGIGTALEGRGPAHVFGHEHYVEHLEDLACAGVPLRHPVTGKVVGVIDLTCWRRDAGPLMIATAATIAGRIEELLLDRSGRRELALLHDYRAACRRNRGAVLAVGDDLLMMNDRARELLGPADQAPLLAEAVDALAAGSRHPLLIELPSGLTARVHCKPSFSYGKTAGGVLQVQLVAPGTAASSTRASPASHGANPVAVGSGAYWAKCCQAVDRHFLAREWLVLEGEPGAGKTSVARLTHQSRTPAAHLRVLDADDYGPGWVAEVADELSTGGGSLLLTHVDRLPPDGVQALGDVLEPFREATRQDRPWVVATVSSRERTPGVDDLLSRFPRTVDVPPLRHHVEDVTELVPHLLARLAHGGGLTCSPEVMGVLMRARWPGNVEQLHRVLRKIVAKRRAGVVELRDLPPECRATTRRVLTPLEAIECDAIVDALLDTDGSKSEAARLLGMSRATIYRKIRGYGISVPSERG